MQWVASTFLNNPVKTHSVVGEKMLGFEEGIDQAEKRSDEIKNNCPKKDSRKQHLQGTNGVWKNPECLISNHLNIRWNQIIEKSQ